MRATPVIIMERTSQENILLPIKCAVKTERGMRGSTTTQNPSMDPHAEDVRGAFLIFSYIRGSPLR